ncbi:MAG: aminoacyl-tRNA hydrolase [bacterium]
MAYLVVGLGNPGTKYAKTRHNIGFMVSDFLADKLNIDFREKENYLIAEGGIEGIPLFILKPLTFMNLSGKAVSSFLRYRNITDDSIFVVYDDLDLPLGKLRLRWNGSGGGHKGVKSVIEERQNKNFYHLKIGIGKPPVKELVEGYVLSKFTPDEQIVINDAVNRAHLCIITAIKEGTTKAMNDFNG